MDMNKPPYTADRFMRCAAHYIRWRAMEIRCGGAMVSALAAYWEKEAQKAYKGC